MFMVTSNRLQYLVFGKLLYKCSIAKLTIALSIMQAILEREMIYARRKFMCHKLVLTGY